MVGGGALPRRDLVLRDAQRVRDVLDVRGREAPDRGHTRASQQFRIADIDILHGGHGCGRRLLAPLALVALGRRVVAVAVRPRPLAPRSLVLGFVDAGLRAAARSNGLFAPRRLLGGRVPAAVGGRLVVVVARGNPLALLVVEAAHLLGAPVEVLAALERPLEGVLAADASGDPGVDAEVDEFRVRDHLRFEVAGVHVGIDEDVRGRWPDAAQRQ